MAAFKSFRQNADDIDPTEKVVMDEIRYEELEKEKGDPWLFDLFVSPRHYTKDKKILPYYQHTAYRARYETNKE